MPDVDFPAILGELFVDFVTTDGAFFDASRTGGVVAEPKAARPAAADLTFETEDGGLGLAWATLDGAAVGAARAAAEGAGAGADAGASARATPPPSAYAANVASSTGKNRVVIVFGASHFEAMRSNYEASGQWRLALSSAPMRVAVVSTSYPAFPGDPSGHFVQTEVRRLAHDADVVVVTASVPGSRQGAERATERAVVWREVGGEAFGWPGVAARFEERPWRLAHAARWIIFARARLRQLGPFDRVVAHWAIPSAFPVAGATDAPLDVVSHGGDVRLISRLPAPARSAVMRYLLGDDSRRARVSRWRFVSPELHDDLARSLLPDARARLERVAWIEGAAIDLPDVTARAQSFRERVCAKADGHTGSASSREARRLVVCVGRLVASKRFDRALDHVARETRDVRGETLVVVVGDGPERARLEARALALGLDARFVGRTTRHDALAWIGAADTLLHASHSEGLSTVVREADSLGVRVEVVA